MGVIDVVLEDDQLVAAVSGEVDDVWAEFRQAVQKIRSGGRRLGLELHQIAVVRALNRRPDPGLLTTDP